MAVRFVVVVAHVVLVMAAISVMGEASDCDRGYGCYRAEPASTEIQSRKLVHGSKVVFKSFVPLDSHGGGNLVGWDLRRAPSGPDPLHHHGDSPKKPQTP
uniref:Uncharacterized protein n=1 Tax=Nelumbo nucifera TaxID=4432 RepID=A0A822YA21_NELNU|nr:TPA_asm: hypothetical protein HUJ06_030411 [Nelumbo nucifera]